MQYSIFTVSSPSFTPEEIVKHAAASGYAGIEWRIKDDPPTDSEPSFHKGNRCSLQVGWSDDDFRKIAELTKQHKLTVPSLGTYIHAGDLELTERMMQVAVIFGAPAIRVGVPGQKRPYADRFREGRDYLAECEKLSKKYGVRALIEMHMGTITPSASAARRLVDGFSTEHIGVIYDTGNMVYEGFEHYEMGLNILREYLGHVHVKNTMFVKKIVAGPQIYEWKAAAAPMREGICDFTAFLQALTDIKYEGFISFEDFSTKLQEKERIADNVVLFREIEASLAEAEKTKSSEFAEAETKGNPVLSVGRLAADDISDPVRCAIVGLGRVGWGHHAKIVGKHNGYKMQAVCDILPDRVEEAVATFPGCKGYADFSEMLKNEDVELVIICTLSKDHESMTIDALNSGKHVLCEKPAAATAEGIRAMIAAAKKSDRLLTMHHQYRCHPDFLAIKEIIDQGLIGDVFRIRRHDANFSRRNDWQTLTKYGGGINGNKAVHPIDQALVLLDSPMKRIFANVRQVVNPGDAPDDIKATIETENGSVLDVDITSADASDQPSWVVNGTTGTLWISHGELRVQYFDPSELTKIQSLDQSHARGRKYGVQGYEDTNIPWKYITKPVMPENTYDSYNDNLYKAIRKGEKLVVEPESALRIYEVLEAIDEPSNRI